ncbi:hypothetical protein [Arenimonas malthae]|uniref:hypothetical protein n=1 Tax=Arenimonas malthae TaxID=354197 RepID=UPI0012EB438D|nr:hypothetical protein [Arenimonas malthae]
MRNVVAIAMLAAATSGCATLPPVTDAASLTVISYDRATGEYVIELRNSGARPILYLDPYLTFHVVRDTSPESYPDSPDGFALMIHGAKLDPGKAVTFSGKCTSTGICSRPGTYVAVHACWFTKAWACDEYLRVWSGRPLNGA